MSWDLLTRKDDLAVHELAPAAPAALQDGEARLVVEKFALTMNSVTYARLGSGAMPFWSAFPAPAGYGRVPVWAFVRVEESRHPGIAVGERYFGFVPMSTHHVVAPDPTARGFLDTAPQREFLPIWYRTYQPAAEPDALDDRRTVFRPVYPASFHLADFLVGLEAQGIKSVLVSGASSKTAIGAAELLGRKSDLPVVGLTSAGHVGFVRGLGCYDSAVGYGDLASASVLAPAVFVDLTGSHRQIGAVHERFAGELGHITLVGYTDPDSVQELPVLSDPEPEFFFTPAVEEETVAAEGEERFFERYHAEEDRFLAATESWLTVHRHVGPDAIVACFDAMLDGPRPPAETDVFYPQ